MVSINYPPVVAGLDGTSSDVPVLRAAAIEAMLRTRPLRVLASYGEPVTHAAPAPRPSPEQARRFLVNLAARENPVHRGLHVDVAMVAGALADAVIAESSTAAVVVTDGVLGHAVVARVRCPLLLVPPCAGPGDGPVLVAVDANAPGSAPVLEYGFDTAAGRGLTLRPVFAWVPQPPGLLAAVAPQDQLAAHADAERMLAEAVAGWAEKFPDVTVRRAEIRASSVAGALIRASASASLVVVGSRPRRHGTGPRARLCVGTVTHALLARARCPIAVVPLEDHHE